MITPAFTTTQDETHVHIVIRCPYVRAQDVEIFVDGTLFNFYLTPYFLRLTFPHPLVEDETSSAHYDIASGLMTVKLTKANPGQHFEDLDLLSKLLAPRKASEPLQGSPAGHDGSEERPLRKPVIEVIGEERAPGEGGQAGEGRMNEFEQAEALDWQLPQTMPSNATLEPSDSIQRPSTPSPSISLSTSIPYGFNASHSGYFQYLQQGERGNEINELEEPEKMGWEERERRAEEAEDEKWDEEYYLDNTFNDEEIQPLLSWTSPYNHFKGKGKEIAESSASGNLPPELDFTDSEKETLLKLPRTEHLITDQRALYLTLVSILFSTLYDARTTLGDPTVESAWTVSKLTRLFAALSPPCSVSPSSAPPHPDAPVSVNDVRSTLRASYRRALAFPLYRHWGLCERVRQDVADVCEGGIRAVVKALLCTKRLLDLSEAYWVYARIWVDDLIVWIQRQGRNEILLSLASELRSVEMDKASVGWALEELEELGRAQMEEDAQTRS